MKTARRNWIVYVHTEHDDPMVLGPYVQHRAEQIRDAINRREDKRTEDERLGDYVHATAAPIQNPGPREAVAVIFS